MRDSRRLTLRRLGALALGYIPISTYAIKVASIRSERDVPSQNVVAVDDYYRNTDDGDWMAAFQRAANAIHRLGGGVIKLPQSEYYLGQYTGADVDQTVLDYKLESNLLSKIWVLPSNVLVTSDHRKTTINLGGGKSSPFGYSTGINVLSSPFDGELSLSVLDVDQSNARIIVSDASTLQVGQTVRLARNARTGSGTPSREDSPNQFLTIKLKKDNQLQFTESFHHRFDSAENLVLHYRPPKKDYPRNIWLENITFAAPASTAYVCHSLTINSGWNNVLLREGVQASWGTSQGVVCDNVSIISDINSKNAISIESTSDVKWGSLSLIGNGSPNPLGGLLINDASTNINFKTIEAQDFSRSGVCFLYGGDIYVDELILKNCATVASAKGSYAAALTVGFPAEGAGPTSSASERFSNKYKIRNTGLLRVHIGKLEIIGPTTVPVRVHDADLTIDDAYIEFRDQGAHAPFLVGQSGSARSDSKYFPDGGTSSIKLGKIKVRLIQSYDSKLIARNASRSSFSDNSPVQMTVKSFTVDKN